MNPQPVWLPLLLLALPGIGFAAYALHNALFPAENRPLCTIPAIGIVLALLPTHLLALAFASLSAGLAVAWTVVGTAGYVWITYHWREFRSAFSNRPAGLLHKLWVTGLATLPIILPTILLNFHDEAYFNGHFAIIAHLQNGTYPPRYLYEPSLPLRYHYGFDLAGAIITGLLRVRLDHAIDILTLALWPFMFLLLWRVGESVAGGRAGLLVALAVCFATGWCALCSANGARSNPPFISYFFQHPWGIGVPIFCLIMLQRTALPRLDNPFLGLLALVCSLVLLSLCQAVLFVATVVALGISAAWKLVRHPDRAGVSILLGVGASLVGAKLAGGFFVSGAFPQPGELFGAAFYLRHFSGGDAVFGQVLWSLETFGLLLILGILGLLRPSGDRVFLMTLALLPFLVINFIGYRHSWDIVKFATVSSISLGIGSGITLSHLLHWSNTRRRRIIWGALVVALLWQGVYYPFVFLQDYDPSERSAFSKQMIKPYFSRTYPVDQDNARGVSFLRTHMGPSEIVYRTERKSEPYAIWGGLPTQASVYPATTGDNDAYGLGQEKLAARRNLAIASETWIDRLLEEHITWVVTDAADDAIDAILDYPEGRFKAFLAAQYGAIRIFQIR